MTSPTSNERVRTREQRVALRVSRDRVIIKAFETVLANNGITKLFLYFATAAILCAICRQWDPPAKYRAGMIADRAILCNAPFKVYSPDLTKAERADRKEKTPPCYMNDPDLLKAYEEDFINKLKSVLSRTNFAEFDQNDVKYFKSFLLDELRENAAMQAFDSMRKFFASDADLKSLRSALHVALEPSRKLGVAYQETALLKPAFEYLDKIDNTKNFGSKRDDVKTYVKIFVYDKGDAPEHGREEIISDILLGNGNNIKSILQEELGSPEIAGLIANRIRRTIPETLVFDERGWRSLRERAASQVADRYVVYENGAKLVEAGTTIDGKALELLNAEREERLASRSLGARAARYCASVVLTTILFIGVLIFFNMNVWSSERRSGSGSCWEFVAFLGMVVAIVGVARGLQVFWRYDHSTPELVPFLFFVQLLAIASSWKLSLSYGVILAFLLTTSGPNGLSVFAVFVGVAIVGALLSQAVKTRIQLFTIALVNAFTVLALSYVVGVVCDDLGGLLQNSILRGFWAFVAGLVTAALLPLFERAFNILTPMRLLEYSNPSHPLLLELNNRAPATYNHSLQTAALAEAAAEKIGARPALVRVGAYFHDVGKMLKPEYFTENQRGYNVHDDLEPRMSSLIIVAHTKDGIRAAKQYHIPPQVVDLIEQHHGTMLVGFFYQKALKAQMEKDPEETELDDSPFRYPGPIPQTKEAAILMIADAVESASRSLAEWTPQRVERLVRAIIEARIREGQFKDSGLTLGELNALEQSFVSSMIAMRHSRVKYPNFGQGKPTDTTKEVYRDHKAQREQGSSVSKVAPAQHRKNDEDSHEEKSRSEVAERAKTSDDSSPILTAREAESSLLLTLGFQDPSEK